MKPRQPTCGRWIRTHMISEYVAAPLTHAPRAHAASHFGLCGLARCCTLATAMYDVAREQWKLQVFFGRRKVSIARFGLKSAKSSKEENYCALPFLCVDLTALANQLLST